MLGKFCLGTKNMKEEKPASEPVQRWKAIDATGQSICCETAEQLKEKLGKKNVFNKDAGDVYVDGSCAQPTHLEAARA